MKKHSAAPWIVMFVLPTVGDDDTVVRDCNGVVVARIPHLGRTNAEQVANAKLVAAAPALLTALELAYHWLREQPDERPSDVVIQQIKLALAKAVGVGVRS